MAEMKLQSSNWAALSCWAPWAGCGSPFSHLPALYAAPSLTKCSWESLGHFWFSDTEKCYLKALLSRNPLPKLACQPIWKCARRQKARILCFLDTVMSWAGADLTSGSL